MVNGAQPLCATARRSSRDPVGRRRRRPPFAKKKSAPRAAAAAPRQRIALDAAVRLPVGFARAEATEQVNAAPCRAAGLAIVSATSPYLAPARPEPDSAKRNSGPASGSVGAPLARAGM